MRKPPVAGCRASTAHIRVRASRGQCTASARQASGLRSPLVPSCETDSPSAPSATRQINGDTTVFSHGIGRDRSRQARYSQSCKDRHVRPWGSSYLFCGIRQGVLARKYLSVEDTASCLRQHGHGSECGEFERRREADAKGGADWKHPVFAPLDTAETGHSWRWGMWQDESGGCFESSHALID